MATFQDSQPDQLNNQEAPLKSSVVISSAGPEDFNKNINQGLINLHSKLDKVLSKSHIFPRTLDTESSIIIGHPHIEERQVLSSRLYETPRMSAPIIYETIPHSYNPFGHVHTAVSQQFTSPVRSVRPEIQYSSPPMYWSQPQTALYHSVAPSLSASAIHLPHSAGYHVPHHAHYHQGPVFHQPLVHPANVSYVAPVGIPYVETRDRNYFCGDLTNDNDSVTDHREVVEDDLSEDEDPRVNTVGKKAKANANNNNAQPVDNGGFVRKGPYAQQKRQNITQKDAQKFFDKPGQIPNFNFGN